VPDAAQVVLSGSRQSSAANRTISFAGESFPVSVFILFLLKIMGKIFRKKHEHGSRPPKKRGQVPVNEPCFPFSIQPIEIITDTNPSILRRGLGFVKGFFGS
jgi:hypothetical protein